jgi:regulator of sigma E protease
VRAFVLVAGVAMNLILAWILLTGAYALGSFPLTSTFTEHSGLKVDREVVIAEVIAGSPAETVGIKSGDKVTAVNDQAVSGGRQLIDRVKTLAGQQISITFVRDGQTQTAKVTPRVNPPANEGALGVSLGESAYVHPAGWLSPWVGLKETGSQIVTTVDGVGQFFRQIFTQGSVSEDVSGIVGIGAATGVVRRLGLAPLLQFTALISTNLAVVNLLPILPLDGGHLLFLAAEKVRKRPVNEKIRQWVGLGGLVLMILLAIVVTYRDVIRFSIIDRIQSLF